MKKKKAPPNISSEHDWQILGEIELTIDVAFDLTINNWLGVTLSLLDLQADFANRILQSAQDAVLHASQMEDVVSSEHIHVIIFIPEGYKLNNQGWGFFRIEKVGNDEAMLNHTIELYLYQEG